MSKKYSIVIKDISLVKGQESPYIQYDLGNRYYRGQGATQDFEKAFTYFNLAAKQGYTSAHYMLGFMYISGQGVTRNTNQAFNWWKLAANQGHTAAQSNLSRLYRYGQGVKKDLPKAFKWCKLAAEQGDEDALHNLKEIEEQLQSIQWPEDTPSKQLFCNVQPWKSAYI